MRTRSWWPLQGLIGGFNLLLAAPQIYLYIGLPMVLHRQGWSATYVGLIQLAGMAALLKGVLAVPVERYRLGRYGYRGWLALLSLAYALVLLLIGGCQPDPHHPLPLFVLILASSLLATWVDTPLNALAIRRLPAREQLRAGAIRAAAISLGGILGGGGMLLVETQQGWAAPFRYLALGVGCGLLLLPWLSAIDRGPSRPLPTLPVLSEVWRHWWAWFRLPGHSFWSLLLLLYYPLIGAAWVFIKPLLQDHGLPDPQVAQVVGLGGGALAAVASLLGGWVSRRRGAARALPLFASGDVLCLGLLAAASLLQADLRLLQGAALLLAMMLGASGGLIFGLTMHFCRPGLEALDYGLQSNVFILGRTLMPLLAGRLLDQSTPPGHGYGVMFTVLLAAMGLLLILIWHRRGRLLPPPSQALPAGTADSLSGQAAHAQG